MWPCCFFGVMIVKLGCSQHTVWLYTHKTCFALCLINLFNSMLLYSLDSFPTALHSHSCLQLVRSSMNWNWWCDISCVLDRKRDSLSWLSCSYITWSHSLPLSLAAKPAGVDDGLAVERERVCVRVCVLLTGLIDLIDTHGGNYTSF